MDRTRSRRVTLLAALGIALVAVAGVASFASTAAAQTARASEDVGLGFKGLGARLGLVDPEGASSTLDLGLHIDAGQIARNIHVAPIAEYWKVGVSGIDLSDLSVGLDLLFDFPLQDSRMTPYAGGGLGLHFVKADDPSGPSDSDSKFGLNVQGGIRNDVMPNLAIFGELRYNFVSDFNQLKILGGFTYRFVY
jgi:opacity protein-like surface antigen